MRFDCQAPGGVWQTREEEILDSFTYDLPVDDRLFEVASPGRLPRPDARSAAENQHLRNRSREQE